QAASDRIALHEKLAVKIPLLAGITTILLLIATIPRRRVRQMFTTFALVASVVTAGWVAIAAHSGGLAVYQHGLGTVAMSRDPSLGEPSIANSALAQAAPSVTAATQPLSAIAGAPASKL